MTSRAREGCQPIRQTVLFLVLLHTEDESVGHVSHGEQKAQTASQKSPGTAGACEGLIELGNCDRVPRNNGVEADKRFFSYAGGTFCTLMHDVSM